MSRKKKCKFCNREPIIEQSGGYLRYRNEIEIASGLGIEMYIGVDENGKVIMGACAEDYTDNYYPKYCPECGRKLYSNCETATNHNNRRGGRIMIQKQIFSIGIEATVNVTSEDIDDIMVPALEGGITYWCCKAEVVGDYLDEYASDQISRGGELILHDAESNDTWTLNRDKLLNGLKMWLTNGMDVDHGICENRLDTSVIDGVEADCIIQYALFDKVVFG